MEAFAGLLDAYGGDRARWPAHRRDAAEALLAASPQARGLLAEAQALDAVLAHAAADDDRFATGSLAERIVTAARPEPVRPAPRDNVVALRPAARPTPQATARGPATARARLGSVPWQAAAVLAGALFTGMLGGALDLVPTPLGTLTAVASVDRDADRTSAGLPIDGLAAFLDEEQL